MDEFNQVKRALKILLVLLVVGGVWAYLFTGTPPWGPNLIIKDAAVAAIELSWIDTTQTVRSSDQCAKVLKAMRKARQSPVPASPGLGTLTLYYADGTTNRFHLQPSGRFAGLEIVNESGGYAISTGEMLDTFENVGLLKKHEK